MSERVKRPRMLEEPYSKQCLMDHMLWCLTKRHCRHSTLCVYCDRHLSCRDEKMFEIAGRVKRTAYFLALWGVQKRLLPSNAMEEGGEASEVETEENEY